MARLHPLALLAVVLLVGACQAQPAPPAASGQTEPVAVPSLELTDLDGHPVSLAALKGKVVIIDFWATWCPPCREAIPDLIDLKKQYGGQGLEVVGISLDDNAERILPRFVHDFGINYPVVIGSEEVAAAFGGILGLPTTFIVDRAGMVRSHFMGYIDRQRMEAAVTGLL
ncbi:MAG: TlpA family protein disulfide reductase [Nitrospirae bacterium CG_4_9_14_0_8_um_filter_70_14]|nr:MAG: TlpA family protein disulfide reductase [Nitrospirae bacterium CG_4_9_14_0_8_um_filter_70_14]